MSETVSREEFEALANNQSNLLSQLQVLQREAGNRGWHLGAEPDLGEPTADTEPPPAGEVDEP